MTTPVETALTWRERDTASPAPLAPLPVMTAASLMALAPPAPALLGPIAPGTITLIRGPRGVGKSWLALSLAHAMAGGTGVLGWSARKAPVLYVEAAMPVAEIARRAQAVGPVPGRFRLICDTRFDLGDESDGARIAQHLSDGAGVLVLDGLSLLVPPGRRAGQRWGQFSDWLRDLRRKGHAILLIDHTSRPLIADLADTVMTLKTLAEDQADIAVAVDLASRQKLARADRAFAAHLDLNTGTAQWTRSILVDPALQAVADQAAAGTPIRDIAQALGLSATTAWRRLERAKAQGLVADKPPETSETRPAAKRAETSETGETGAAARKPPETSETNPAAARPPETAPARDKPRETGETTPAGGQPGETGETSLLARVATEALQQTLEGRLRARRRGDKDVRLLGPAILAQVADADLLALCAARLKPKRAQRLRRHFAPLLAPPRQAA